MTEANRNGFTESAATMQRREDCEAAEDLGREYQAGLEAIRFKEDWDFKDAFLSLLQGILSLAFRRGLFRKQTPEAAAAADLLAALERKRHAEKELR